MIPSATAYKFLARGAVAPISGFAWPFPREGQPGPWIVVEGGLSVCRRGLHVCRTMDLSHWLHDELWELEIGGAHLEALDCVVVERARLVRRIDAWSDGGALRFAQAAIAHASEFVGSDPPAAGFLDDAARAAQAGYHALAAFGAALAVARRNGAEKSAFRDERGWQSAWIAREAIGL